VACQSKSGINNEEPGDVSPFSLTDFYAQHTALDARVEEVYAQLNTHERIGQMIVTAAGRLGKPDEEVERLVKNKSVGGVLLLNGTVDGFIQNVKDWNALADRSSALPLLYSADAEPSLINRKIEGSPAVSPTIQLNTQEENKAAAKAIANTLLRIGIYHNYAPVVDLSPMNKAIGNRSYGRDADSVVRLANAFIQAMQSSGIAATAKHFPGHGLVHGDTHSRLVYIEGDLQEVDIYKPMIEQGVISIMVGHIAVRNNAQYSTDGLPASCSRRIVTDLLKDEMQFDGLVVTDAMNMGALKDIPQSSLLAAKAGADIILMPPDEEGTIEMIQAEMEKDIAFQEQIAQSVKKIIRLKLCLGLLQ
jgi:beta-N-acetylhexosaminidase